MSQQTDMVISFDTTGSMSSILMQVRRKAVELVREMFATVDDLRIGVIVHGDYCDQGSSYLDKTLDLSNDEAAIVRFIETVGTTFGGSWEEAYDHVLRITRSLGWRAGSQRALVMIGDAECHPKSRWGTKESGYVVNPNNIDWKNECKILNDELKVKVFGVHAMSYYSRSRPFWEGMANLTGGTYLTLDQFGEITQLLKLLFYHQSGQPALVPNFVKELVAGKQMTAGIARTVEALTGELPTVNKRSLGGGGGTRRTPTKSYARVSKLSEAELDEAYGEVSLEPVPAGRFQLLDVGEKTDIKGFVNKNVGEGVFKKGAGFYQFGAKSVKVQAYKVVVLIDKESGDLWTGDAARKMLGLPKTGTFSLKPSSMAKFLKDYEVFIQSTSVNRALLAGDQFLYETSEWDRRATA